MVQQRLQYDNLYWTNLLGNDAQNLDSVAKIHLILSLILFLGISLKVLLHYLFTSKIQPVANLAGRFTAYRPDEEIPFGPSDIYNVWDQRFEKSRPHLTREVLVPHTQRIVLQESNDAIHDKDLQIRTKSLTMKTIRTALDPDKLEAKYRKKTPFLFGLLDTFTNSPNDYQKKKSRKAARAEARAAAAEEMVVEAQEVTADASMGGLEAVEIEAEELQQMPGVGGGDDLEDDSEEYCTDAKMGDEERRQRRGFSAIVFVISALLYVRNRATNLLPLMLGLFLKVGGASTCVMGTFNSLGVCVGSRTVDRVRAILSNDAWDSARAVFAAGCDLVFWIFDNINIYVRHFDQRLDDKNSMINATNIVLVKLPPDAKPGGLDLQAKLDRRGKRAQDREGRCIKITKEDADHMDKAFVALISQLLCAYWPGRERWGTAKAMAAELDGMTPKIRPRKPYPSETFPIGVVGIDEGSKKGIVQVLEYLWRFTGLAQEVYARVVRHINGDLGTIRNLRGARRDRTDDINGFEQLRYVQELSQPFHWAFNAVHMLIRVHLGNAIQDPGSLSCHKDLLGRTWDVNRPDYAHAKSLLRHSLIARLLDVASLYLKEHGKGKKQLGLTTWDELKKYTPTIEEIKEIAQYTLSNYATTAAAARAKTKEDDILAHTCLFIHDVLLFLEYESAVSHADAGRMFVVIKFWAYMFRGAGLTNYAREALELLVTWAYELPGDLKFNMEALLTVNKRGRNIASDMYIEQLNKLIKVDHVPRGSGLNIKNIMQKGSACVEALEEISCSVAGFFGRHSRPRQHVEAKFQLDLRALFNHMQQRKVHIADPGRILYATGSQATKSKGNSEKP